MLDKELKKCSLRPIAIHQSYCNLSHKWRKLLHENAAVPEENLCDLSQHISFPYLNMLWAHRGTGVDSEGLHWHLLTTHTSMSLEKVLGRETAPSVIKMKGMV